MTLIEKIKALWSINKIVNQIKQEEKMETTPIKSGWKTTEFWTKVLTVDVPALLGVLTGVLPAPIALKITIASTAIYTIARVITKAISDFKGASTSSSTTSTVTVVTPPAA